MKIFITHGHNDVAKLKIKDYLATQLSHKPVILGEQPGRQGLTIIEALEQFSKGCEFALILLTGEDMTKDGGLRARQNVVHEAGYFQGCLGREKVVLIVQEGIEIPSNLSGLFCLQYKNDIKEVFTDLQVILKAGEAFPSPKTLHTNIASELRYSGENLGRQSNGIRTRAQTKINDSSIPCHPLALLNGEVFNEFLQFIPDKPLSVTVRKHFSAISELGFEDSANEDEFIHARLTFWSAIGPYQSKLAALLRQYISSVKPTLDSLMIVFEFGRILAENRRGHLAYEILGPLEDLVGTGQVVVPDKLSPRILDGIGEAARFADDYVAAKRLYNKALALNGDDHFALKHLGTIFRIDNDFLKAKECFEKALGIHRTYHVLFSLAYLFHDFKHYDEAKPFYDECIETLKCVGKTGYYRVYFKQACLHLIRGVVGTSEDALDFLWQTLRSLNEHTIDSAQLDDFAKITRFAVQLLISVVHNNKMNAIDALNDCEYYLAHHIDCISHSAFYCAYNDIERVFSKNTTLLPTAHSKLGVDDARRLEHILDRLRLKHLLLQSAAVQRGMRSLDIVADRIEALVKPVDKNEKDINTLKHALRTFEVPPWRILDTRGSLYEVCKMVVADSDIAFIPVKEAVECLLDRASISLWLRHANRERPHSATDLKAFTAVVPEDQRRLHFQDYFYLVEQELRASGMVRIIGKKLICLDPLTKNRVFINPTIGCGLNCEYCYLPEYSITHNKSPIPAGINGANYRAVIKHDERVTLGKEGTLLSIGSFCEPFLPEIANLTVDILNELRSLGNPIHIATKCFPGSPSIDELVATYADDPTQLMVNLSLNDLEFTDVEIARQWLTYSTKINIAIYIKPFLSKTYHQLSRFAELGHSYPNVSFIVGSFYVGNAIRRKLSHGFSFEQYSRNYSLISPVVEEPSVEGFKEEREDIFREQLEAKLNKPVFKTASCALSLRRGIRDPLGNYQTSFCIGSRCSNFDHICRSADRKI